ncbi:MAG: tripartite tricarboxylate transporter TctB family protein [Boseongicola sp.]
MRRKSVDILLVSAILVAFLAAFLNAVFLPWQAAILPLMLSGLGAGLSVALVIALAKQQPTEGESALKPGDVTSFLWFIACVLGITLLGFKVGGFIFAFLYFRWSAGFGWITTTLLALPVPIVSWLAFEVLLGQLGFDGLLLGASF